MIIVPDKLFDSLVPQSLTEDYDPFGADSQIGIVNRLSKMGDSELKDWLKNNAVWVGAGSSRVAYILKDMTCLKVSKSKRGQAQNKQEYVNTKTENDDGKWTCFSEIYDADTSNWKMMQVEMAKTAKETDFYTFVSLKNAVEAISVPVLLYLCRGNLKNVTYRMINDLKAYIGNNEYDANFFDNLVFSPTFTEICYRILKKDPNNPTEENLGSIYRFFMKNGIDKMLPADLVVAENWGVVYRNKVPQLIIIDSGFSEDVWETYYL